MTVREALHAGAGALAAVPDPRLDAELLLCRVLEVPRMTLLLSAARELTPAQEARYQTLLSQRAAREPLQYILGSQSFYGCELLVDERVLIPRPETELLCERALKRLQAIRQPAVADVCTGSGALAIAIKRERPDAAVWAADLSDAALALARENAECNGAAIEFRQGDLLRPLAGQTFDGIVCNPPYIPAALIETLQPEVTKEPRMALDGGIDGLDFYHRLANEAPDSLKPGGLLFAEFGDGQAAAVATIFTAAQAFQDVRIHRDLAGHPRFVEAAHRFP